MTTNTAALLASVERFSTCEISDALIKTGSKHGGYIPDINLAVDRSSSNDSIRICGPAFTVLMVDPRKEPDAPKPSSHFVDAASEGCIMLIQSPRYVKNACWGGLMTARAKAKGVRGVVIDGRCRDLAEHREAQFPVFARGHSTLGQSPFVRPSRLQVPLTIKVQEEVSEWPSVTVEPGDIILADEDGVVCIPLDKVEQVVGLAQKGKDIDALCMRDLQAGRSVQDTFGEHRGK